MSTTQDTTTDPRIVALTRDLAKAHARLEAVSLLAAGWRVDHPHSLLSRRRAGSLLAGALRGDPVVRGGSS